MFLLSFLSHMDPTHVAQPFRVILQAQIVGTYYLNPPSMRENTLLNFLRYIHW